MSRYGIVFAAYDVNISIHVALDLLTICQKISTSCNSVVEWGGGKENPVLGGLKFLVRRILCNNFEMPVL